MKRSRQAFSLIEILIVITIIAVLIGLAAAGGPQVMKMVQKGKAQTQAVGLRTSLVKYKTDYGDWPTTLRQDFAGNDIEIGGPPTQDPMSPSAADNQEILWLLSGNTNFSGSASFIATNNPKRTVYYDFTDQMLNNPKAFFNSTAIVDPWGRQFNFAMDNDGDRTLKNLPDPKANERDGNARQAEAAVWSYGPNPDEGARDYVTDWGN